MSFYRFSTFGALTAAGLLIAGLGAANGQSRIEIRAFPSVTTTDQGVLSGSLDGDPAMLAGELRLPGPEGPFPAVILLHHSSGLGGSGGYIDAWVKDLNAMGVATFAIDWFSGRGLVELRTDQNRIGMYAPVVDAFAAKRALEGHPKIDPARIAVMGFSRGAITTVALTLDRIHSLPGGGEFAAYVALYPDCKVKVERRMEVTDRPILILGGEADDYTPLQACRDYADQLRAGGADIELIGYSGAYHAFDNIGLPAEVFLPEAVTIGACRFGESEDHRLVDLDTGEDMDLNAAACLGRGPHIGYNEAAHNQARLDVRRFLTRALELPAQ